MRVYTTTQIVRSITAYDMTMKREDTKASAVQNILYILDNTPTVTLLPCASAIAIVVLTACPVTNYLMVYHKRTDQTMFRIILQLQQEQKRTRFRRVTDTVSVNIRIILLYSIRANNVILKFIPLLQLGTFKSISVILYNIILFGLLYIGILFECYAKT